MFVARRAGARRERASATIPLVSHWDELQTPVLGRGCRRSTASTPSSSPCRTRCTASSTSGAGSTAPGRSCSTRTTSLAEVSARCSAALGCERRARSGEGRAEQGADHRRGRLHRRITSPPRLVATGMARRPRRQLCPRGRDRRSSLGSRRRNACGCSSATSAPTDALADAATTTTPTSSTSRRSSASRTSSTRPLRGAARQRRDADERVSASPGRQSQLERFLFASTSEVYAGTLRPLELPIPDAGRLSAGVAGPAHRRDALHALEDLRRGDVPPARACRSRSSARTTSTARAWASRTSSRSSSQRAHAADDGASLEVFSIDHRRTFCYVDDAVEMHGARAAVAEDV